MPRNSSGTMSATNGPYTSGTTISSVAINARFADVESEITDSASRTGKGGFTAPIRGANGTVAAPTHSYTSETGTGEYLAAAGDLRIAVGGVDALKLAAGGVVGPLTFPSGTTSIQVTLSGGFLLLQGNVAAADASNADVQLSSTATRTAGYIASVQNPVGTSKLLVDYHGLLSLAAAAAAAAIQPASILTSLSVGANWAIVGNLAFWKDGCGTVHIQGGATPAAGAAGTIFTMPAGFRPRSDATPFFVVQVGSGITTNTVAIDPTTGACSAFGAVTLGATITFGSITYLAGQ